MMRLLRGLLWCLGPILSTSSIVLQNHQLYDNAHNAEVSLRGLSWFGFETQDFVVDGLWQHPMTYYLDLLQSDGFNFLRVPFSAEWIFYNWDIYPSNGLVGADPSVQHKKSIEILDTLFLECMKRGIYILLDLHRLHKEFISPLWYSPDSSQYTSDIYFTVWERMLSRYLPYPNLFGIDMLNEPHDQANIGSGNPSTDWGMFVENAIPRLANAYPSKPDFFFLVEGVQWGHDLSGLKSHPLALSTDLLHRVIYSAHTYGYSVVPDTPSTYEARRSGWQDSFGFLVDSPDNISMLIIGEWGGVTHTDEQWMNDLVRYLSEEINQKNTIFWSLGPNSGDVQGYLLDDWSTVDTVKKSIIQRLQPSPTHFVFMATPHNGLFQTRNHTTRSLR